MKAGFFVYVDEEERTIYYDNEYMMMEEFYEKYDVKHEKKAWWENFFEFQDRNEMTHLVELMIKKLKGRYGDPIYVVYDKESKFEKKDIEADILRIIEEFSKPRNWKYGYRQKYLFKDLYELGYGTDEIKDALDTLVKEKKIYYLWKHNKPYYFISKKLRY